MVSNPVVESEAVCGRCVCRVREAAQIEQVEGIRIEAWRLRRIIILHIRTDNNTQRFLSERGRGRQTACHFSDLAVQVERDGAVCTLCGVLDGDRGRRRTWICNNRARRQIDDSVRVAFADFKPIDIAALDVDDRVGSAGLAAVPAGGYAFDRPKDRIFVVAEIDHRQVCGLLQIRGRARNGISDLSRRFGRSVIGAVSVEIRGEEAVALLVAHGKDVAADGPDVARGVGDDRVARGSHRGHCRRRERDVVFAGVGNVCPARELILRAVEIEGDGDLVERVGRDDMVKRLV